MSDTPTLVRFTNGWVPNGVGEDGLPRYREAVMVIKERPPLLRLPPREATEQDIDENPDPYRLFQKEQASLKAAPTASGFPLALWPVVSAADLRMLAARDIVTVEQLAGRRADDMPPELKALAERARQMIDMTSNIGKYEQVIRDLEGKVEALTEQNTELRATIKTQDGIINSLKLKVA